MNEVKLTVQQITVTAAEESGSKFSGCKSLILPSENI